MGEKPIGEALGLGDKIVFSDGTQLPCVPANLEDLEASIGYWNTIRTSELAFQGFYLPENEKVKEAFEELLFIACGRNIPKEELRKKIRVTHGGLEVIQFIDRFLGFEPRGAGAEQESQK